MSDLSGEEKQCRHGEETRITHRVSPGAAAEPSSMYVLGLVVHAGAATQQQRAEYKGTHTHPNMRSGWAIKSVMRSSMLLGSSTNVGKVTFERSMPTLSRSRVEGAGGRPLDWQWCRRQMSRRMTGGGAYAP